MRTVGARSMVCMRWSMMALIALAVLLSGCGEDPVPKPRGWFRIDLPPKEYATWEDPAVFSMEVPIHAQVHPRTAEGDARWYDVRMPGMRATVHLTWSRIGERRLGDLIEDAHGFKAKHELKAFKIGRERVVRDSARVFGTLFDVEGDVASPLVFYLTDSTSNFLYGALYFDARPNADSLAPVTARIREDVRHMVATLRWAEGN